MSLTSVKARAKFRFEERKRRAWPINGKNIKCHCFSHLMKIVWIQRAVYLSRRLSGLP